LLFLRRADILLFWLLWLEMLFCRRSGWRRLRRLAKFRAIAPACSDCRPCGDIAADRVVVAVHTIPCDNVRRLRLIDSANTAPIIIPLHGCLRIDNNLSQISAIC
jgi:hypothetical protein